ncbi:MAG TPA: sugar phosphate nucleotidyltransferase [Candidatus Eisenbacteria bacterium]|jgi:mannose-1-phosphate guanylyltransferase
MLTESSLWVVVLAGGEGRRLASATVDPSGTHVPKQFCRFGSDRSVLTHALERAGRLVEPDRVVAMVQAAHRRWWEQELRGLPRTNVIAQRGNRGTAVAVLHALGEILQRDREAHLLVLPSDQEVEDERAWAATLRRAADAALGLPEHVVLVGVEPQADPDFGWIVPGERSAEGTRTVVGFSEKPSAVEAARLVRRGALCSAFVFAASSAAFLDLFSRHPCEPIAQRARALCGSVTEFGSASATEQDLPYSDFSHDLLEHAPERARVVSGAPCGWTDLGTPERLRRWLERHGPAAPKQGATLLHPIAGIAG